MTLISNTLNSLNGRRALVPFITAGNPSLLETEHALRILDKEGADIIELGLPYSDPLADGPIIQAASKKALDNGINLDQILNLLDKINHTIKAPLVFFTYYNPILARGIDKFLKQISEVGIKGLIVPDLPLEEADYLMMICTKYNIELILLISPMSSEERIDKIIEKSHGTIYIVSSTGVTGLRQEINTEMEAFIDKIKMKTNKLLILGFGISTEEHVVQISRWNIEGIVIGSAFVKCLSADTQSERLASLQSFCSSISRALIEN